MAVSGAQDARLEAIAAAAAAVLAETEYHEVRTQDIAARVRLHDSGDGRSARGRRSAVWIYNEARSRRVLVALAARHAWNEYLAHADRTPVPPGSPGDGEPETVTAAVEFVAAALLEIARFHRASQFLMRQVGLGIGDIATSEKRVSADGQPPPSWPDSAWGQVAADGFDGRCSAFADYLAPVLLAAARAVCPMTGTEARKQALALSDLAFRALSSERDGPLDGISDGLAAYWFERDLVRVAGHRIRFLMAAERGLAGGSRGRDPRADAMALGVLADLLLEYGALNARCAAVGATRVALLAQLASYRLPGGEPDPGSGPPRPAEPADLRALCDAASRQGLALLRFGDLAAARQALQLSRVVAVDGLPRQDGDEAASYAARADHNLAAAALDRGAHQEAAALCASVYERRRLRAADGSLTAWRRFSLTAELRVQVTVGLGHPVAAVAEAERLADERARRLGGTDNASVTAARVVLGQALLAAGHPLAARYHLEAARRFHEARNPAFGFTVQREVIDLARVALALDDPVQAERLLPAPDAVSWIAEHVSVRLAAAIRGLRAIALARGRHTDPARELVDYAVTEFPQQEPGRRDPVLLGLDRCRAEILWRAGQPEAAAGILAGVLTAEQSLGDGAFSVAVGLTLRQLARCADAAGDRAAALGYYAELRNAADGVLDPTHVVLLRADLEQSRRLLDSADIDGAGALVTALLDRRLLGHGRPRLEDGHPLLAAARRLGEEIGIPVADALDQDWVEE